MPRSSALFKIENPVIKIIVDATMLKKYPHRPMISISRGINSHKMSVSIVQKKRFFKKFFHKNGSWYS